VLGLEKIVAGAKLRGVAGTAVVEVVRVEWIGLDALNVVYRDNDGPAEVLLFREAEPRLELVQATRAFSFDGDGEAFRIASEAQRVRLAHHFETMKPITTVPHRKDFDVWRSGLTAEEIADEKAAKYSEQTAAMCFGLFVWEVFMEQQAARFDRDYYGRFTRPCVTGNTDLAANFVVFWGDR
jgi:hypothetical protein